MADHEPARPDPYAVMRPRWGRMVAFAVAGLVMAGAIYGAVTVPGQEAQKDDWSAGDRVLMVLLGGAVAWLLWRFGRIEAQPTREGLRIRNLMVTRDLKWTEIVRVQFSGGLPWASIDLADTETLAVMAIQKSDGAYGRALAARLAALVQVHSTASEPPLR